MEEIKKGVFLQTKDELQLEKANWDDLDMSDSANKIDYSIYNFWVTTEDGQFPEGFDVKEDAIKWVLQETDGINYESP